MARDWSAEYNALPSSTRVICAAIGNQQRLQHLQAEKNRLTARYKKSLAEIDDWMANIKRSLVELEEQEDQEATQ